MIVKTILVKKHSFDSFEVDSIGPVSETANDIRTVRISRARYFGEETTLKTKMAKQKKVHFAGLLESEKVGMKP